MKFHLCFVSFCNSPVPLFFRADTSDGLVLSRFVLRNHCRVGTFIRSDLLRNAFHVSHPDSFDVDEAVNICYATQVVASKSFWNCGFFSLVITCTFDRCLDTEIRVLCTTQSIFHKKNPHLSGKNVFCSVRGQEWWRHLDTQFSVSENISSNVPSNIRTEKRNSARSKTFYICQAVQTFDLLFLNLSLSFWNWEMCSVMALFS